MRMMVLGLGVVALLALAGVGTFVLVQQKQEPAEAPIATVTYTCAEGRTIDAAYFSGGEPPAAVPGEPPQPTGYVEIRLDGGEAMTLHQTVSGSGVRYANEDESFVFWNKGDEALIMRDNTMDLTYTDCVDMRAASDASGEQTGGSAEDVPVDTTDETAHVHTIDVHAIPLGDGNVSTEPKRGYVYSCQTNFRGGGAEHAGDWIEGATWDLTKKISVFGDVSWPEAVFSTYLEGGQRLLKGNGLPVDSATGVFPIAHADPAYQYDRNPNSIEAYTLSTLIPANPTIAASPSCVPMGPVGYALNGVAVYNALDDAGRDAVAHEVQDVCSGHPQQQGQYHYHGPSDCMPHADENNALVGYALDGFGIYSMYDENGREYTNDDLDACHGITSEIDWNGTRVEMYHYVLTREYPYTIGCFRGTPVTGMRPAQTAGGQSGPPQEAVAACDGKPNGASCSVGPGSGTCRTTPEGGFACVP